MARLSAILCIFVVVSGCGQSATPTPDPYRGLTPVSDAVAEQRAIELCQRQESLMEAKVLHTKPVPAEPNYTEVLLAGTIAGQPVERFVWIHKFNGKGDKIRRDLSTND
jgi:hypothetical protein